MAKLKLGFVKKLYVQVMAAILLGAVLGACYPEFAISLKPLSDAFIKLIKMLIAPIIFLSLVSGIAAMQDIKEVGKIGASALLYFFITTTLALAFGLMAANMLQPGRGLNIEPGALAAGSQYLLNHQGAKAEGIVLNFIPHSFLSPFIEGEIVQVLFIAILFSFALLLAGEKASPLLQSIKILNDVFFKMIQIIMYLAPLAAFAAMAFSIGQYGISSLLNLLGLVALFFMTCLLFIFVVLGTILKAYCKVNIFHLLGYIKTELWLVLGTSSSETALPMLMEKLKRLGCEKNIVGLVLPVGYSFNLDGTAIYLTLAALFIGQATNIDLSFWQQLSLLAIMIISSKGAAGVSGSGFLVLASSLAALDLIPVAGVLLILSIDRFMSDGRALTNMIGNTVAAIIIAAWHKGFDSNKACELLQPDKKALNLEPDIASRRV